MGKVTGFWAHLRRALLFLIIGWFVLTVAAVLVLRWVDPPITAFMIEDRLSVWISKDPGYRFRYRWVDWNRISPHVKLAVICSEDQRFPDHYGFDLKSIDDAVRRHARGHRLRGASTISQQTAKNLFLWPGPNWTRKAFEVYFTLLIESVLSKERILEIYLNIAEFDKGIFGVGAASTALFHKPAARLTAYEAALLAAVLPSPKRLHAAAPSNYLQRRASWIVAQMQGLGGTSYLEQL